MSKEITVYSLVCVSDAFTRFMHENVSEKGIRIRFTRTNTPIHNESINMPGDGEVVDGYINPHITLLHYVDIKSSEDVPDYMEGIQKALKSYMPPELEVEGTGHRDTYDGDPYTCYVKFAFEESFYKARMEAVRASKDFMSDTTFKEYLSIPYFPHSTILYDDADFDAVRKAEKDFDVEGIVGKEFVVDRIVLEKTTFEGDSYRVENVAEFAV